MTQREEWLSETSLNNSVAHSFKIKSKLYEKESNFQNIKVIDTFALGKVLLLDDMAMISDKDEFIYHEVMTHTPILNQASTKHVLVIGAGDGGIVRELTKYKTIESITMVEIDQEVTNTCLEFFPNVTSGLSDPRVKIVFQDAIEFIKNDLSHHKNYYDLIISDSTDPEGLAEGLYKSHFYKDVKQLLNKNGIFMCQTETPFYDEYNIAGIYKNLREEFKVTKTICAPILIYPGVYWTFALCSNEDLIEKISEAKIKEYSMFSNELKWHDLNWHMDCFNTPKFVKHKLGT